MLTFLVRRTAFALLLVFVVSSGALVLVRLAPGDAASDLVASGASLREIAVERQRLGLDRPLLQQYGSWLADAVRLDFGRSAMFGRPVRGLVAQRAANTALLALVALMFATLLGVPLGIVSGSGNGGAIRAIVRGASLVCLSMPPLVLSLLFVLVAARTGWLPLGGMTSIDAANAGWRAWARDIAWHVPLPALALSLQLAATLERTQAQATAQTLAAPFMLATRARGVPPLRALWRDSFKASLRPVASIYGLMVGGLLSGSFAVEFVTGWPGLGRLMFDALRARDLYLVAGCAAAGSVFLALGTLLSDVLLALTDARVRER